MNPCKPKPCKWCKEDFAPYNSLQVCCSIPHAVAYTRMKAEKAENRRLSSLEALKRKDNREAKERLRTRSDWLSLAQTQFNKFIRLRDAAAPCICCGKHYGGQYHAGHYLSIGAHPELRFNEDNCHKQKSSCNSWKSGNQAEYRIKLIEKIGLERVEALEGPNPPLRLTVDGIKAIRTKYRLLAKELDVE